MKENNTNNGRNNENNAKNTQNGGKFPGFDENMFPESTNATPVPGVKPFTKYRLAEVILCALAVVGGLLYLYTSLMPISVLLPAYTVGLGVITALRYLDMKKSGGKGAAYLIPVAFSGLLTILIAVVTVMYFTK